MNGNDSIWMSEAFNYGLMILNVVVVASLLVWAWRRGHLDDLESAGAAVAPTPPRKEGDRE
jgi:hypothetical protein